LRQKEDYWLTEAGQRREDGYGLFIWNKEKVLELSHMSCTAMGMYFLPLECTLQNG
jgi:hypothetical protein